MSSCPRRSTHCSTSRSAAPSLRASSISRCPSTGSRLPTSRSCASSTARPSGSCAGRSSRSASGSRPPASHGSSRRSSGSASSIGSRTIASPPRSRRLHRDGRSDRRRGARDRRARRRPSVRGSLDGCGARAAREARQPPGIAAAWERGSHAAGAAAASVGRVLAERDVVPERKRLGVPRREQHRDRDLEQIRTRRQRGEAPCRRWRRPDEGRGRRPVPVLTRILGVAGSRSNA